MVKDQEPDQEFITNLARQAGKILLDHEFKATKIKTKGLGNFTLSADKASEAYLTGAVQKVFPTHQILAEEEGLKKVDFDRPLWVIDPLDGTGNFAGTIPIWAVSIAYYNHREGILGAVYCPRLEELFLAEKGKGAYLNGKRIYVSSQEELRGMRVAINCPYTPSLRRVNLQWLERLSDLVALYATPNCAVWEISSIAAGRYDVGIYQNGQPWDWAAAAVILIEAGGKITKINGTNWSIFEPDLLASNGRLHNFVKPLLTNPFGK